LGFIFGSFFLITGCSSRFEGYGVVLWNPNETEDTQFANGQLVGIIQTSDIRNIYTLGNLEDDSAPSLELERWRVRMFDRQADAQEFAESFSTFAQMYARSRTQGLPMRITDDNLSTMVYRLRRDERVKVLFRQEEQVNLSGLQGYWYQGLTETGVTGWVFGVNLDIEGGDREQSSGPALTDELLLNFVQNTWRPESFIPMIQNRQFDLRSFSSNFGLFSDPEAKLFRLVLPQETQEFNYSSLYSPRYGQYLAEGTTLQITLTSLERAVIQYESQGRIVSLNLVTISEDLDLLVESELSRRQALLDGILKVSRQFQSPTYGRIEFLDNARFSWNGYETIQSDILPPGFNVNGRVVFDRYLSENLRNEYTGVLSFLPPLGESWPRMTWLYTLSPEGLRLEHYGTNNEVGQEVTSRALSPFIVFFQTQAQN